MSSTTPSKLRYWLLAVGAVILDQITKSAVLAKFEDYERLGIIPGFFDLTLVYNTGAAFSFLATAGGWQKYFFIVLAAIVCLWLVNAVRKNEFGPWGSWGAVMVIGGAVGNVIDRFIHGWAYPAFNVADSFICVGAVLLVIDGFVNKRPSEKETAEGREQ